MKTIYKKSTALLAIALFMPALALAQENATHEAPLCEAAKTNRTIEMVYDKDVSKGCLPRLIDVHLVSIGKNGSLYMRGWQKRGCTKGRDFAAKRIFKFEKIKSVKIIEGDFNEKSQAAKAAGWDGCLGSNCFIEKHICE